MAKVKRKDIYDEMDIREIYDGPFGQPDDREYEANPTHPRFDTGLDEQELYDEGLAGASGFGDFANPTANERIGWHSTYYNL